MVKKYNSLIRISILLACVVLLTSCDARMEEVARRFQGLHCLDPSTKHHPKFNGMIMYRLNYPYTFEAKETRIEWLADGKHALTVEFEAKQTWSVSSRGKTEHFEEIGLFTATGEIDHETCEVVYFYMSLSDD